MWLRALHRAVGAKWGGQPAAAANGGGLTTTVAVAAACESDSMNHPLGERTTSDVGVAVRGREERSQAEETSIEQLDDQRQHQSRAAWTVAEEGRGEERRKKRGHT